MYLDLGKSGENFPPLQIVSVHGFAFCPLSQKTVICFSFFLSKMTSCFYKTLGWMFLAYF